MSLNKTLGSCPTPGEVVGGGFAASDPALRPPQRDEARGDSPLGDQ